MALVGIRAFFAQIDGHIYGLIGVLFELIEVIATIDIFSGDTISGFATRIYSLLGIFMLFKISFSFINYLVNPDKFTDKQTGFSKIIVNIILVIIMLMSAPWAFSMLKNLQKAILEENILDNIILGTEDNTTENQNKTIQWDLNCAEKIETTSTGEHIALLLFRPFYQYNNSLSDTEKADGILCQVTENNFHSVPTLLNPKVYLQGEEMPASETVVVNSVLSVFVSNNLINYQVDYTFFISTIVGIIVCGLIISFALDVAVRSIKFSFLEIIAPIPIISYIDPDKSKHKLFNNWIQDVFKTWFSLFLRIGALYLIIYVIRLLDFYYISHQITNMIIWSFICIFFIIGALIFAKKLPSMIENITGIKLEGGMFEVNPLKKIRNEALGGKQVTNAAMGAIGAGVGMAGSAVAHGLAYNANRKKLNAEQSKLGDITSAARQARLQGVANVTNARGNLANAIQNKNVAKTNFMNDVRDLSRRIGDARRNGDYDEVNRLTKERDARAEKYFNVERPALVSSVDKNKEELTNVRRAALLKARTEKAKVAEQQAKVDELKNKRINSQPFISTAGEIGRGFVSGAKNAYQADTLNVGKIISAGLKGTDEAAIKRNYREDFSIKDELAGNIASFARIKNESGTSSEVDEAIKKLRNQLTRDTSKLDQLGRVLTDSINSVSMNAKSEATQLARIDKEQFINRYSSYERYKNTNNNTNLTKEEFDSILEAIKAIISTQNNLDKITKDIKKYEKIQENENKKGNN